MESIGLVLLVLAGGHVLNAFVIWLVHLLLHQRILGIPLYRVHLGAHHRIDYVEDYVLDVSTVVEHSVWGAFTLLTSTIYFLLFPGWIAILLIAELLASAAWSYYLHDEYENPDSKLKRFKWYRRGKALHQLHHSYRPEKDAGNIHRAFHHSVNYSFGGPLLGALMDRLFGTYREKPGQGGGPAAAAAQ
jgi:sterol desaturase/sphingolipid hydroxylase (fatty acid hydroxylase superfamily)